MYVETEKHHPIENNANPALDGWETTNISNATTLGLVEATPY
jgi:hypothetical protein